MPPTTPFPTGWMSFDLGPYRPCDGTYCFYEYETLPPLEETFRGEFQWLLNPQTGPDDRLRAIMDIHKQVPSGKIEEKLHRLLAEAPTLGLTLPDSFVRFMGSPALHDEIPSCTACYFDLPEKIVKSPVGDGYIIRFLNDQQDVLLWYLYLTPDGDHFVFVSNIFFDDADLSEVPEERILGALAYCAPDFETFLYRYWLENTIWFSVNEQSGKLTDTQKKYLSHYGDITNT
ncbi:MAG: hypothetical protein HUU38_11170 [Anaerolineales bacterium]|nr:hypothetical protein [Anaerolineales bacterium]